jgi:hypothetical protein
MAVIIADGGRLLSDLSVLRNQPELYGSIASDPTLWRTLSGIDERCRDRLAWARAKTRIHIWKLISERHGGIPAAKVADGDLGRTVVIRLNASIVIAHSDKELAAATFNGAGVIIR